MRFHLVAGQPRQGASSVLKETALSLSSAPNPDHLIATAARLRLAANATESPAIRVARELAELGTAQGLSLIHI